MLKELGFKYVIFSINNANNPFNQLKLLGVFNTLGLRAPVACIGCYKGEIEPSWITTAEALDAAIAYAPALFDRQESYLLLSECNKQYAMLWYPVQMEGVDLGSMCVVSEQEAKATGNWTYRPDTGHFHICKHENPDKASKHDREQRELWGAIDQAMGYLWLSGDAGAAAAYARLDAVRSTQKPKWLGQ